MMKDAKMQLVKFAQEERAKRKREVEQCYREYWPPQIAEMRHNNRRNAMRRRAGAQVAA